MSTQKRTTRSSQTKQRASRPTWVFGAEAVRAYKKRLAEAEKAG